MKELYLILFNFKLSVLLMWITLAQGLSMNFETSCYVKSVMTLELINDKLEN